MFIRVNIFGVLAELLWMLSYLFYLYVHFHENNLLILCCQNIMFPNFMLKQAMRLGLVSLGKLGISLAELYIHTSNVNLLKEIFWRKLQCSRCWTMCISIVVYVVVWVCVLLLCICVNTFTSAGGTCSYLPVYLYH